MEFYCKYCKQLLRIDERNTGKKVRCPTCSKITISPIDASIDVNSFKKPPPLRRPPPPLPRDNSKSINSSVKMDSLDKKVASLNECIEKKSSTKTESLDKFITLGIDFGSSRTKVAHFNKDSSKPELLELGREVRNIIPSVFYLPEEGGDILVGDNAQDMVDTDPQGIVINLKTEIHRTGKKRCGAGRVKPERIELASELFKYIKHQCETEVFHNHDITSCILTVPVCFQNQKRECIKKAAELAGFTEIKLIEEPVAAARHWLTTAKGDVPKEIIICDIGGGTTDLAILQYKNGKFISYPKIPSAGIPQGGNDVDDAIWEQILDQCQDSEKSQSLIAGFMLKIRKIKESLKKYAKSIIPLSVAGSEMGVSKEIIEQTIADFVGLVQEEVKTFADMCQSTTTGDNHIPILLVGGASRLNGLKEAVEEISTGDVYLWKDSDYATVLGATCDDSFLKKHTSLTDDVIAKDIILCPKCELPNKKQNKFCSSCGEPLTKLCPECSHEISIYANNCTSCGTDVDNFLLVKNLLPELKKLATLNLWNEIILKADFLPDKLLLKGSKGKKILKSLNNYTEGAKKTLIKISELDNDIKQKMKQRKFLDALQIFKKLAEISPDSYENNTLHQKLTTMSEFDIFTTDIDSKMKSKLNLGSYTEVLKLRDELNTYLKDFNKKIKKSELDFDNANLQLFLDPISETVVSAEKRINSFEEKCKQGMTAYKKGNYKSTILSFKEALTIYPLSSRTQKLKELLIISQISLYKRKIITTVLFIIAVVILIIAIFIGVEISKKNKINKLNKKSLEFIAIADSYFERGAWLKACDNYESAAQIKGQEKCLDGLDTYTKALFQNGRAEKNKTTAFTYYKKAAERGHAEAQDISGICFLNGTGVAKNQKEAMQWFNKAAEQGISNAMHWLGVIYYNQKKYSYAVKWYEKAERAGEKIAYNNLAECYYWSGRYPDAITYFKKAINSNESISYPHIAQSYELTKNYYEAIDWYTKSLLKHPKTDWIAYNLGNCYMKLQETGNALEAYANAVERGSVEAANKLGDINFYGEGVTENKKIAFQWYMKAAAKGNAKAQGQVGWYYLRGQVVGKNYTEALKWIKKSANQRDKWGQRWLGECYEYGYGVKKNLRQAFGYYKASAINRGLKELKLSFGYTDGVFNDDLIIYNNDNCTWTNVDIFVEREFGDKNRYASKYASYKELKQNGRIKYVNLWSSVAEVAIKKKVQFSIICDQGYFFKTYTAHTGVLNKNSNWRTTSRF